MTIDGDEGIIAELLPDGHMSLWEEDDKDERLTFKRVVSGQSEFAPTESETASFLGKWISDDPEEDDLGLQLESGGVAIATEGERTYRGQWRVEASRLFLTVDNDEHLGQLLSDGRLLLWEDGDHDHTIMFKRPATQAQLQAMTLNAAEAGFLGRWVCDDPNEDDLGLRIEPDGVAIATEGDKRYDGRWSLEGSQLTLHLEEEEELLGELIPGGRLSLREVDDKDDDDRILFRRPTR